MRALGYPNKTDSISKRQVIWHNTYDQITTAFLLTPLGFGTFANISALSPTALDLTLTICSVAHHCISLGVSMSQVWYRMASSALLSSCELEHKVIIY